MNNILSKSMCLGAAVALLLFQVAPAQEVWKKNTSYTGTENLWGITYFKGKFIIGSGQSGTVLIMDANGNITKAAKPPTFVNSPFAFSPERIVVGSNDYGNIRFATSEDGNTWQTNGNVFAGSETRIADIAYNDKDKNFYSTWGSSVLRSKNGLAWDRITSVSRKGAALFTVLQMGSKLIAAGDGSPNIISSEDGTNWFPASKINTDDPWTQWYTGAYGNGVAVIAGVRTNSSQGTYAYSTDGDQWTQHYYEASSGNLWDVIFAGDRFVMVGANATVLTSLDGKNWARQKVPTTLQLSGIAYGDGRFVAVGVGGTILTSDAVFQDPKFEPLEATIHPAFELQMKTTPGKKYQIQYSDDGGFKWSNYEEPFLATEAQTFRCASTRQSRTRLLRYYELP